MSPQAPTSRQAAAVIFAAVVGGSIPALQPILLGGLLAEQRLDAVQIGQSATIEGLCMAIASVIAGAWLKPSRLRLITSIAALGLLVANSATAFASGAAILLLRGLNGAASGVLLWLLVGLLTRAAAPARLFAIYVTCQAIGAFVLSSVFTTLVVPRFGVSGGYGLIAALSAVLLPLVWGIPAAYAPIRAPEAGRSSTQWPTGRGAVGLLAVVLYLAGVMSFWVYFAPLAAQLGHDQASIGRTISLAIGVQILGGLAASILATRLRGAQANLISAIASALAVLVALNAGGAVLLLAASAAFAFFWMFAPPFHLPLLIEFDPSHRSAMFVSSAQLLGMSAGPMLASMLVADGQFVNAGIASVVLFAASAVVSIAGKLAR